MESLNTLRYSMPLFFPARAKHPTRFRCLADPITSNKKIKKSTEYSNQTRLSHQVRPAEGAVETILAQRQWSPRHGTIQHSSTYPIFYKIIPKLIFSQE